MASALPPARAPKPVSYPDSDGEPMSDNSIQFTWISILKWNAEAQFRNDPNVFVAGDHLIYPTHGDADLRQAPDVYVAFGRPKGYRGSYKVWEEGNVFPQVVFEVWSPHNRYDKMAKKFEFYQQYGAEEYYIVYPEFPAFIEGWVRRGNRLMKLDEMDGFVSPRLGWKFRCAKGDLDIDGVDGRPLRSPVEIIAELEELNRERAAERERAARLAAKLRELGVDPDAL